MITHPFAQEIGRKLIHLSSLWMVAFIVYFDRETSVLFFAALFAGFFAFEYLRMENSTIRHLLHRYCGFVMRDREQVTCFQVRALTGSFYFILAVLIDIALFDRPIAVASILVMILADTAAALVGKACGRHVIPHTAKTVEGSTAFFLTALVVIGLCGCVGWVAAAIIALCVALTEIYSEKIHLNDNLTITLMTSVLLYGAMMAGF